MYYGWIQVIVLGFTQTTTWGILYYAYPVLLPAMEAELGWSRTATTGAFSLALVLSGIAAVPVGRWLDRRGARGLMTVGSALAALLVLAWSQVDDLLGFYLVWAGLGLMMAATLYEPAFAVVATWFVRRRGQALTVLTGIAAFASTVYQPLTAWLLELQGWRGALVTLAVLLGLIAVPLHALVLRRRPEDMGLLPDGAPANDPSTTVGPAIGPSVGAGEALRGATFWWLAGAFAIGTLCLVAVNVHMVPYLADVGHGTAFAATASGLIGAMKLPARIVFGPLGDRLSLRTVTAILFVLQAIALVLLVTVPTTLGVLAFAVLFGIAVGAMTTARPAFVAELYGRASFGTISGVLTASGVAARAVAPVGIGLLYDGIGTYLPALAALAGLSIVAVVAVLRAETSRVRRAPGPRLPAAAETR